MAYARGRVPVRLPSALRQTVALAGSTGAHTVATIRGMDTAVRQYSRPAVLAVWAAAALPMGALAWVVAPALAGPGNLAEVLMGALCAGLVWQFALVLILVAREQGTLRWPVVRDALWLRVPRRLWLRVLPFVVGFAALQFVPFGLPAVASHDFGAFLGSAAGRATLHGNWALYALALVMFVFTTVLGEELLFRGLLLPRMRAAFGRADWVVNGLLFGLYHLHQPWSIPASVVAGWLFAYPSRRWHSAWLGIIAHSTQSVFLAVLLLVAVLR
jgi:uncharacterized protein